MEISDDYSQFQTVSDEAFVRAGDLFASPKDQSFKYAWGDGEGHGEKLFSDILSLFYRSLDALSGRKSYLFLRDNFVAPDFPRPYRNILTLLKRRKMLGACNLSSKRLNGAPFFYKFKCSGAPSEDATDGKTGINMRAVGISKNRNEAASKMIGEFCERYFLTLYRNKNLLRSSVGALKKKHIPALPLDLLAGFSEKQKEEKRNLRWNDASVFRWEKCLRVSSGEPVYIPADIVYWNYQRDIESGEPTLREHNTNGCGGYFTKEGAILSGLYELIQRDAFLYWYLNTLTPPKIDPESVSDETFRLIFEESKRYGITVHCLNMTIDTQIPSVAVILENRLDSCGPHFAMGGGCEANPERALRRAAEEAWSIYLSAAQSAYAPKFLLPELYALFCAMNVGQLERISLFANPLMRSHYEFLIRGVEKKIGAFDFSYPTDFSSEKEELSIAVKHLERLGKGYEIYAFLPEHHLLSKLGYVSARVIVPRLIPLYLYEANAPLGSLRLRMHPSKIGIAQTATPNNWPHPFP